MEAQGLMACLVAAVVFVACHFWKFAHDLAELRREYRESLTAIRDELRAIVAGLEDEPWDGPVGGPDDEFDDADSIEADQ